MEGNETWRNRSTINDEMDILVCLGDMLVQHEPHSSSQHMGCEIVFLTVYQRFDDAVDAKKAGRLGQ